MLMLMHLYQLLLGEVLLVHHGLVLMYMGLWWRRLLLYHTRYHMVVVLHRVLLADYGVVRVVPVLRRLLLLHPAVDQRLLRHVVQTHPVVQIVVQAVHVVVRVVVGVAVVVGAAAVVAAAAGKRAGVHAVGAGIVVGRVAGIVPGLEAVEAAVAVVRALVHDRGDR